MKSTILVALGAAFFIIGVHQSFYYGIPQSYWLFMLSGACFLLIQYFKKKDEEKQKAIKKDKDNKQNTPTKKKRKKK
ncbi:hypothetical protein [Flammeovirga agarivorans]|uniref:Uncharacterized protein n=1 Tax=Flammeovirga agarivorans TaxID=2726742 RepID=A0A7X8XU68_9BACT|nr:hypothetical protein [Flammeovirga agarivorans]NLR90061.1 hypothetical protein [Flammeovirga agarivorans]